MASDNAHARALTLTDAVGALVVAGDGDVDELGGRVNVAEGDDGDVSVTSLSDGLVVSPGVRDHQQTGLAESGLDLIGEGSGSEASSDGAAVHIPAGRTSVNKYAWELGLLLGLSQNVGLSLKLASCVVQTAFPINWLIT